MAYLSMFFVIVSSLMMRYRCQGSLESEAVVLVTDVGDAGKSGSIYIYNVSEMNLTQLEVPNIKKPFAIDYDVTTGHVYWTDVMLYHIRRATLTGVDDVVVAAFNSSSLLGGLTLDGASRKLFYTDEGRKIISRMDMDSMASTVIVHTDVDQPRGIVADTKNKNIYWTDLGKVEKIEMSDYSGGSRKTVVTSGLSVSSGIALDEKAGRLFWCGLAVIGSVVLDGSGRRSIVTDTSYMLDVTVFNGLLYYTALQDKSIYTVSENGQHKAPLASQLFHKPIGIHAFSPNINKSVSCPSGQYGARCESCGHCEDGACEKTTGVCLIGCAPGYRMPKCREGCTSGTFGVKCQSTCFNCKSGSTCDHVTGRCPIGCTPGWRGDNCNLKCPNNTYGACTPCGLCAEDDPCHLATGHCPRGCKFGWTGSTCTTGWLIFGAAGAVIVVIVVVVIGGAVYNARKLKMRYQNSYVEFAERCNRLYEL